MAVTWTVKGELGKLWQAAKDREAMRIRMEEAEAALARLKQEQETQDVDDGASSTYDGDWPTWSDSDEEEEEEDAAAEGRGRCVDGPEEGAEQMEEPCAALVMSPREEQQSESERKCDDILRRLQDLGMGLRRLREEAERVLAFADKPRRGVQWTRRPVISNGQYNLKCLENLVFKYQMWSIIYLFICY